jgi:hypothetical protein
MKTLHGICLTGLRAALISTLCLVWNAPAYSFWTVNPVVNIKLDMVYGNGPGNAAKAKLGKEKLKKKDFLKLLNGGNPGKGTMLALFSDCNDPDTFFLGVWDRNKDDVAEDSDYITFSVEEALIAEGKKTDSIAAFLSSDDFIDKFNLTAHIEFSEISGKLIPADPGDDETKCMSKFRSSSATGYAFDAESNVQDIVTSADLKAGKPIATTRDNPLPVPAE